MLDTKIKQRTKRLVVFLFQITLCQECTNSQKTSSTKTASSNAQEGVKGQSSSSTSSSSTTTINTHLDRTKLISALDLDTNKFLIMRLSVGMETYIQSQTPVLNFDRPVDSDYVEIMRCPTNIAIQGAADTIHLENIELTSLASAERDRLYRNNDFYRAGIAAGCTQLTQGMSAATFYDSWAPNGRFRYLIRACVAPERLTDTDKLSNRNCTRQVAISSAVKDYVNSRTQQQRDYLQKATAAAADLLLAAHAVTQKADEYACYIQWCECGSSTEDKSICQRDAKGLPKSCSGGEHGRAVALAKKKAIVTLVAVSAEMLMNIPMMGTSGQGGKVMQAFEHIMDKSQWLTALGGMAFSQMFQELSTQTQDFPRACSQGISIDLQMVGLAQNVMRAENQYNYYACLASTAQANQDAASGVSSGTSVDLSTSKCPTNTVGGPSGGDAQ